MRISNQQLHQQGIAGITDRTAQMIDIQQQLASGQRVRKPSDDPTAAAGIVRLNQDIAERERYLQNSDNAEAQLVREEAVLTQVVSSLQRVRELTLQAGDPVYTELERANLGAELEERFDELMGLLNAKGADGNYLFSGYQGDTRPFSFVGGTLNYHGDEGQRLLAIDEARSIATGDAGRAIFAAATLEQPTIRVRAMTGAGAGDSDAAPELRALPTDRDALAALAAQRLLIEVRSTAAGAVIDVRSADDGTVIAGLEGLAAAAHVDLPAIGVALNFTGGSAPGDAYLLDVSAEQDLLTTVHDMTQTLLGTGVGPAQSEADYRASIDRTLAGLDGALEDIVNVRARIGARLNAIDGARAAHGDLIQRSREVLSTLRDVDFAKAASDLSYQAFVLEAAQQSFVRINGLSLFNQL